MTSQTGQIAPPRLAELEILDLEGAYGDFQGLWGVSLSVPAGGRSGGEQRRGPIGGALGARPLFLTLGEPFLGISQHMVGVISEVLQRINKTGMSILLIDQDVHRALTLSARAFVLDGGRLVLEGDAKELLQGDAIRKIYMGDQASSAAD